MVNEDKNRMKIMGILNITPDSFSDGQKYMVLDNAIEHANQMIQDGADIIDIGGESTRPNSTRISWEEEIARIRPVLSALKDLSVPISVDTMNSSTALACMEYGVNIINDVSGGLYDPNMYKVVADNDIDYVCQHWRVNTDPIEAEKYWKLTHDVMHELHLCIENMHSAGIKDEKIILDPGLGFYKNHSQSWELLNKIDTLRQLGYPILIGASRKRMTVLYGRDNIEDRDKVTAKISVFCADHNVWGVRVHNVGLTKKYLDERVTR